MEPTLGLIGGTCGGGGLSSETVSTVTKVEQDYLVGMFNNSEASTDQNEAELELGLGLSLSGSGSGCGCGGGDSGQVVKSKGVSPWGEFGRILTAKDFPSGFSSARNSASAIGVGAAVSGTKRAADCVGPPEVGSTSPGASQVVGWPPVGAYRMNSLINQAKAPKTEDDKRVGGNDVSEDALKKKINQGRNSNNNAVVKEKGHLGFVKVNIDGLPIGRKVDLNAHTCYETLAQTLEDMFFKSSTTTINSIWSGGEKEEPTMSSKLLDGSSEFVLTYEDKEGDWMLVGDIPWGMFLSTVKRLRIKRTSEANGLSRSKTSSRE